jgi:hypothetical protein
MSLHIGRDHCPEWLCDCLELSQLYIIDLKSIDISFDRLFDETTKLSVFLPVFLLHFLNVCQVFFLLFFILKLAYELFVKLQLLKRVKDWLIVFLAEE